MGQLEPVNMVRVIEELKQVVQTAEVLGGLKWAFMAWQTGEEGAASMLCRKTTWMNEFAAMKVSLRRLGVLLNNGDIDLLDCDRFTRDVLRSLWEPCGLPTLQVEETEFCKREHDAWRQVATTGVAVLIRWVIQYLEGQRVMYLGDGRVSIQGDTVTFTSKSHVAFLEHLVTQRTATTQSLVSAGVSNPSKTAKEIRKAHGGRLEGLITTPGKDKRGYSTTIVDGRKELA